MWKSGQNLWFWMAGKYLIFTMEQGKCNKSSTYWRVKKAPCVSNIQINCIYPKFRDISYFIQGIPTVDHVTGLLRRSIMFINIYQKEYNISKIRFGWTLIMSNILWILSWLSKNYLMLSLVSVYLQLLSNVNRGPKINK